MGVLHANLMAGLDDLHSGLRSGLLSERHTGPTAAGKQGPERTQHRDGDPRTDSHTVYTPWGTHIGHTHRCKDTQAT